MEVDILCKREGGDDEDAAVTGIELLLLLLLLLTEARVNGDEGDRGGICASFLDVTSHTPKAAYSVHASATT